MLKDGEYRLVIPAGYTREEYLYLLGEKPEEKEAESFWDKRIKVDPFTGAIIQIVSELFIGFIKCFLFFLEAYPRNLAKIREEDRLKAEKKSPLSPGR